jgi:uncharacterized protein YjbI with pentapeptide repeats
MSEDTPTCQIHNEHKWIECSNPSWPGDSQGLCILHCRRADKDKDGEFSREIQAKMKSKKYDFPGVFFPGQISFHGHIFVNPAEFQLANFNQEADFSDTIFAEMAEFDGATFSRQANFHHATFNRRVDFHGAIFAQGVYFGSAYFGSEADFYRTTFIQDAVFIFAIFGGPARFVELNPQREGMPLPPSEPSGIFFGIQLCKDPPLLFQDLSLSRFQFERTDLRWVEFRHVQWHLWGGRQAIYDEVLLRQEEKDNPWFWKWLLYYAPYAKAPSPCGDKCGEVERLYRNLKINYEIQGDYKNSGDFHYGEMEMHRRASKWRWFPFYWYNLYWFLSGYGERPSRAFGLLGLFLFGIAGLICWLGLEIAHPQKFAGFGDTFVYILQKATLQRPEWAKPITFGGNFWTSLSVLFIPGQAALFLLALRNRLGRRR